MTKQHILDEIKRTAAANSGQPLGESRFAKETGIKDSDWEGKFWVRWSDAVREAGFKPNEFLTAVPDDVLFEKLISLTRELGHVPLKAELQMKVFSDSGFPSHHVFRRAFGPKPKLVARLRQFCEGKPEYSDVLALCPVGTHEDHPKENGKAAPELFGFVYLLKSGRYYKIGHTNAVGRRERELQIQLPDRANTVHTIKTDDPQGIEDYWHRRFAAKRKNGEWFELDASDVKTFRRRTFM